jgi:hypothetical protein
MSEILPSFIEVIIENGGIEDFTEVPSGTSVLPSISFIDDKSTGVYLAEVGRLGIVAGRRECLNLTEDLITLIVPLQMGEAINMGGNSITNCDTVNIGNTTVNTNSISTNGSLTLSSTTNQILVASNPTAMLGVASKQYVDSMAGLKIITPVRVVTDTELVGYVPEGEGVGKTLTAPAIGALIIDGIGTVLNDRILVNNIGSLTAGDRGVYYVSTEGTEGVSAVLTRAEDFDESDDVLSATFVSVLSGTLYYYSGWVLIGTGPYTVDTTPQEWVQFTNNNNTSINISNIGVGGVSVYKGEVNNNFQFKSINSGARISITDDIGQNEIDIDVIEGGIVHNNLKDLTSGHPHTQYLQLIGDTMTGAIVLDTGMIGAPSLTFDNSLTTGLYSSIAGNIEVVSGGAEVAVFSPTGVQAVKLSINNTIYEEHSLTHNDVSTFTITNIASDIKIQIGTNFSIEDGGAATIYNMASNGDITTVGNMTMKDDKQLVIGNDSDFTISHISGTGDALFDNVNVTGDTIFKLGDAIGGTAWDIQDSGGVSIFNVTSDGDVTIAGTIKMNLGNILVQDLVITKNNGDMVIHNASVGNTIFKLGDSIGGTEWGIQDSLSASIFNVTSDGNITTTGNILVGDLKTIIIGSAIDGFILYHSSDMNDTVFVNLNGAGDTIFKLGDSIGGTSWEIQNFGNAIIYNITSDGDITTVGNMSMKDDKQLVIGNGSDFTISHISGTGDALFNNVNVAGDTIFKLGDAIGGTSWQIQDSNAAVIFNITSNGDITFDNIALTGNLSILDDNLISLGNGSDFTISHISGTGDALFNNVNVAGDTIFKLGDTIGGTSWQIQDSNVATIFNVASDGDITTNGILYMAINTRIEFVGENGFFISHDEASADTTFQSLSGRSVFRVNGAQSFNITDANNIDILKAEDNQVIVSALEVKTGHNIVLSGAANATAANNYSISFTGANQNGNAINRYWTYVGSAAAGDTITINKSGIYSICGLYTAFSSVETVMYGWITLTLDPNTDLTTSRGSVLKFDAWSSTIFEVVESTYVGYLVAGSILRIHIQGGSAAGITKIEIKDAADWRIEMNFIQ